MRRVLNDAFLNLAWVGGAFASRWLSPGFRLLTGMTSF